MVKNLKNNHSYIKYIENKIKKKFPEWKQYSDAVYEGQINNNFRIDYIGNIRGYTDSVYEISFVKDRGLLELRIYHQSAPVHLGHLISNGIIQNIPDQDKKWILSICVELIDYYIEFLELFFEKREVLKVY